MVGSWSPARSTPDSIIVANCARSCSNGGTGLAGSTSTYTRDTPSHGGNDISGEWHGEGKQHVAAELTHHAVPDEGRSAGREHVQRSRPDRVVGRQLVRRRKRLRPSQHVPLDEPHGKRD